MAAIRYYTQDRVRVPSVTSVIKHLDGDAEGLIRWAHRLGTEGKTLEEGREAANIGTICHAIIEGKLQGETVDLSNVPKEWRPQIDKAMEAWDLWWDSLGTTPEMLATEASLVSEKYRFGGTMDLVYMIDKETTLLDIKTGNRLYGKELAQIAGYGIAWEENHPERPIDRYSLLRLGKDDGAFTWHHTHALSMDPARQAFLRAREIYDLAKVLGRMV